MRTLLSNYRPSVRREGVDGFCTPRRELPMRRVTPCHGVLTARTTPTAQAVWKSWYVSAPFVTFNARRIATQTSTDSYVCATPFDSTRTWKMYSDCWVTCLTVETAEGQHCITSLTALSTVGHELKVSWAAGSCTSSEYHRTPPKISRRSVCHTGHIET